MSNKEALKNDNHQYCCFNMTPLYTFFSVGTIGLDIRTSFES